MKQKQVHHLTLKEIAARTFYTLWIGSALAFGVLMNLALVFGQ